MHTYHNAESLARQARELCEATGLTQTQIAKDLGVAQSSVHAAINYDPDNPTRMTQLRRRIIEHYSDNTRVSDEMYWRLESESV